MAIIDQEEVGSARKTAGYVVLGLIAFFYLRSTAPEKLAAFGSVVADEPMTKAEEGGMFDDRSPHTPGT